MEDHLASFHRVSLTELNQRAALMTRRDNKYLLTTQQVIAFMSLVDDQFDVLQIDGKTAFNYDSAYFDSESFDCFRDHNQNRRKRLKVRYRHYEDTKQYFLEVKLKGNAGLTYKLRRNITSADFESLELPTELGDYIKSVVKSHYQRPLQNSYSKTLNVRYARTTLVSKSGAERVTMDNRLHFAQAGREIALSESLWVVEVKSSKGVSATDRVLKGLGARPASLCSKYCVGLSLLFPSERSSRFTPILKKIAALS